jgi:hypothetical protein
MENGSPSTRRSWPRTDASPPNRSCQYSWVRIAFWWFPGSISSHRKFRPSWGETMRSGKNVEVTRMVRARSVLPASPTVLPHPW